MPAEPHFRLGRYWLDTIGGRYYRFWYDAGLGEVRRRSLKTAKLEDAKVALAAHVLGEGSGRPEKPQDVLIVSAFARYQTEHANNTRSRTTVEVTKNRLLDFLGNDAKVAALTRSRQREYIRHLHALGYKVGTIAHFQTLTNAAMNYAARDEDENGSALLLRAPRMIYSANEVAGILGEPDPLPRNWHPDLDMIATFLNGLEPDEECLRRFALFKLVFACRSEAALEAGPFALDRRYKLVHLNPPNRRQTKKYRPTLPVPDNFWATLDSWSDAPTFVHIGGKTRPHLTKRWNRARDRAELPDTFIPHSFRHFMATELRHAHLRYDVPKVPAEEREMWLGHRRLSVHDSYGTFEPEYLSAAKTGVEAILDALNAKLNKPLYRQVSAKTVAGTRRKSTLKLLKSQEK